MGASVRAQTTSLEGKADSREPLTAARALCVRMALIFPTASQGPAAKPVLPKRNFRKLDISGIDRPEMNLRAGTR